MPNGGGRRDGRLGGTLWFRVTRRRRVWPGNGPASIPRPPPPAASGRNVHPARRALAVGENAGDARSDCGRGSGLSPRRYVSPSAEPLVLLSPPWRRPRRAEPRKPRAGGGGWSWSPASSGVRAPGPTCERRRAGRGGQGLAPGAAPRVRDGGRQARRRRARREGGLRLRLPPGLAATRPAGSEATRSFLPPHLLPPPPPKVG